MKKNANAAANKRKLHVSSSMNLLTNFFSPESSMSGPKKNKVHDTNVALPVIIHSDTDIHTNTKKHLFFKDSFASRESKIDWEDSFERKDFHTFQTQNLLTTRLWEDVSKPLVVEDIKGQESAKSKLEEWSKDNYSKPLLVCGPSGCGKTVLIRSFLSSKNFRVWDDSMMEEDENLEDALQKLASQLPLIGTKTRAVLIECLEGISGETRTKLAKLFASSSANASPKGLGASSLGCLPDISA
jgi:hypothetical protein